MHVDDIVGECRADWVCVTGGEPCIWDLDPLFEAIRDCEKFIHLETAGYFPMKGELWPDWLTVSPKANKSFTVDADLRARANEFKFVVDEPLDLELLNGFEALRTGQIVLMPEGCPPRPEMVRKALDWLVDHPNWRYSDRLQYRLEGVK